jgi:aminoglycoside phosphotransferase (APT) family kinase protein
MTPPRTSWRGHPHVGALDWVAEQTGRPVAGVRELAGGWTSTMLAVADDAGAETVLRLLTREPWRTHGAELADRESSTLEVLAGTGLPVPRSLALDATGARCGHPAHLMTLLPGTVEPDRSDDASLRALAGTLAAIHAVPPAAAVRLFESWAWEAKYVVPAWARQPGARVRAFALLRTPAPAPRPTLLHRDFQPRNVLWTGAAVTGVVDWVETSVGPAWLDVAHCATNLALEHGTTIADRFARAYVELTGAEPAPYLDVMDLVGFLPPPGRPGSFDDDPVRLARLEERLVVVLDRIP